MAVTVTATLLSGADPRPVQVALNGTSAGQAYEIRGTTGDGSSWPIPGGVGVSAGSQVLVLDNRSALNVLVTYQAVVDGATYSSAAVTIAGPTAVLQLVDGSLLVPVEVVSVQESRKATVRSTLFEIAGRSEPAARLDVPGSTSYSWVFETSGPESGVLRQILESGRPVVRRLGTGLRDLKPVVLGVVTEWSDALSTVGLDTLRTWSLTVREIGDPQPSTPLAAFTWEDFDSAMSDRVWSYHYLFPTLTGWTADGGTLSLQTSGGYLTPNFARGTASTASANVTVRESAYTAAAVTLGSPVADGDVITVTARVKGTAGRSAAAVISWSGGTQTLGSNVTLTGSWQMVSVTATAPAGTTGLAAGVYMYATGVAVGDVVDVSAPTVSRGTTVPVGSFDEMFGTWDIFDAADWSLV
jgi:hypothetical protein